MINAGKYWTPILETFPPPLLFSPLPAKKRECRIQKGKRILNPTGNQFFT